MLLVLLASLVLAGCAGMPTSGPVHQIGSSAVATSDQGPPNYDPLPPQQDASRAEIVRGFINAMVAIPSQTRTAKLFLTDDAAERWNPQQETITYAEPPTPRGVGGDVVVRLVGADRLDARGAWQGPLPASQSTVSFPMALEDGQWRIERAPDALIVPQDWYANLFRQVSVYFFDPTAQILVPEPVFVPRGEQLATTLTQALLLGPGPGLEHVTQTFVPPGLSVAVGVTVSDDGVADVILDGDAGRLSAKTVELMMAQFAWTLRQEPQVQSIRLSIGGEPVPLPDGVSSYRVDGGAEYDPAGFQASALLYGLSRGRLVAGTPSALVPVGGPLGQASYGLRSVGVSLDATTAAGVTAQGRSVVVAPVAAEGGAVRTVASGTDLLRPAWDFSDRMWMVDRTAKGAVVSYADDHGSVAPTILRVPGITGAQVRMFLVSRDGTRLLAVVRRAGTDVLLVSRIEHASNGRVTGAVPAERIQLGDDVTLPIRDITWRTSASIDVLNALTPSLAEVAPASVDGAPMNPDTAATAVDGRVLSLAGSPVLGEDVYGVTPSGLVNVTRGDRGPTPFARPTRAVVYVG
ncbi:LpqB family beta-propeller domain-containing protein [Nocardioides sp.]|uniref:LpqB family beta-propeller domain-containing protein n=1 Tax=Nocardioides sp. TaxID=35761 RepID=UPI0037838C03